MANADPLARIRRYLKKSYSASIAENNLTKQKQLYSYITEHRLSDSIELLENQGYSGDDAICRLQYLQMEEVC
jgi:hypothetical protein